MTKLSILIAEDEEKTLRVFELNLGAAYTIVPAKDGREALAQLRTGRVDIVLTDMKMPHVDGQTVLREAHLREPSMPVIVITAFGSIEQAVAMMKQGAFDYLVKPIDLDRLDLTLERAANHVKLTRENRFLRSRLEQLEGAASVITASPRMQKILSIVKQTAHTGVTVLVEGETGTGKELIARMLHTESPRSNQPFVAVNCGAIPHELLESELFGSEKGAFTGAGATRAGKFEQANHGTLFLDEIGELPRELQVKLLRAFDEQSVTHVGGHEPIPLDVRIVAATNRTLKDEADAGRFRMDLYFRLNIVHLTLPPLRERKEDIPLLVHHFLEKHREEFQMRFKGINRDALLYLEAYHWPGNIRELENTIVRSMVTAQGDYITLDDIPTDIHLTSGKVDAAMPGSYREFLEFKKSEKQKYILEIQSKFILEALRDHKWNISQTSLSLGMDRRRLQNMMKEAGIQIPLEEKL
ncbi:MAG TPA: sigma-54 dependent transcriptional regulator [Bacteroidota bacterium]|nr:sigma-54 dependent transcriptional regulator [Bacteroidota bacterium]